MPGASTKRARSDDDQQLLPDEFAPSPPKRTQTRKTKTLESQKSEKNYHSDDDDETSSDEPTSSSGSSMDSSDDDSDNEEDEQETSNQEQREGNGAIPSVAARQKPRIHRIKKDNGIMSRLTAFLPQMKSANEHLERELAAGRGKELQVDGVDEENEGRYIEMVRCVPFCRLLLYTGRNADSCCYRT